MKYAILSDIHSNLEAFSKALEFLPKLKIDRIICLGDVVGYNANPNEIIDLFYKMDRLTIIRGNHDRAVSTYKYDDFSYNAVAAIQWTIKHITRTSENFLNALDMGPKFIDDSFAICHGSPLDEDYYIFTKQDTKEQFAWMVDNNVKLLFFGHTHIQKIYSYDPASGETSIIKETSLHFDKNLYYLVNPGSIGQPRDGDPKGSFAVFDSEKMAIKICRFEYDIRTTQQKIMDNNLPFILASRLSAGR